MSCLLLAKARARAGREILPQLLRFPVFYFLTRARFIEGDRAAHAQPASAPVSELPDLHAWFNRSWQRSGQVGESIAPCPKLCPLEHGCRVSPQRGCLLVAPEIGNGEICYRLRIVSVHRDPQVICLPCAVGAVVPLPFSAGETEAQRPGKQPRVCGVWDLYCSLRRC